MKQAHLKELREHVNEADRIYRLQMKTETHNVVLWSSLPEPARREKPARIIGRDHRYCDGRGYHVARGLLASSCFRDSMSTCTCLYARSQCSCVYGYCGYVWFHPRECDPCRNRCGRLEPDCTTLRELDVNLITVIGTVLGQVRVASRTVRCSFLSLGGSEGASLHLTSSPHTSDRHARAGPPCSRDR